MAVFIILVNNYKTAFVVVNVIFVDMQKFPLRMKDNDLLVTELYRDPNCDPVTAISVYLTPKTSKIFNFKITCMKNASDTYVLFLFIICHQ